MKKIILSISFCLVLFYCVPVKTIAAKNIPTETEVVAAEKRWPGSTLEELKEGHGIYYKQCIECHKTFKIPKFSENKWEHEINDMSPKAKLTTSQKQKLTKYIFSFRDTHLPPAK